MVGDCGTQSLLAEAQWKPCVRDLAESHPAEGTPKPVLHMVEG